MPFTSLTSQLSSAAGKRTTLTAGSSRTTNPDRRHCHTGRGHVGSPCPEDVIATWQLCTFAHAGAGREAEIPWRHMPLLKWVPQMPSCFPPRLLCKLKCLFSTFGVLKGVAGAVVRLGRVGQIVKRWLSKSFSPPPQLLGFHTHRVPDPYENQVLQLENPSCPPPLSKTSTACPF